MTDPFFSLSSSTRALANSEDAVHLIEQKGRVEQAVTANDPALTLDTAKAFLESVFKTILSDRVREPNLDQDLSPLYKCVRDVLPLNRNCDANEILKRLTNSVVHHLAELRNNYGAASHGGDGYFDNPIEMPEAEMVARFVDGLAGFLFYKHKAHGDPTVAARIYYGEYPEFDDFLDNQWQGYELPLSPEHSISLPASKIIFLTDPDAYREMLLQYRSSEKDNLDD